MPISYTVNSDDELVTLNVSGRVTTEEFVATAQALVQDQNINNSWSQLVDLRGTEFSSEADQLCQQLQQFLLAEMRPHLAPRVAIVVDDDLKRPILAEIFHLCCRLGRSELFEDYAAAIKWLLKNAVAPSLQPQNA